MKRILSCLLLLPLLLAACTPAATATTAAPLRVQYTAAATSWLADLYDCAGTSAVDASLRVADTLDLHSADLVLRLGTPSPLTASSYQVGTEDILVIVNKQNPTGPLIAEQVYSLFSGRVPTWKDFTGSEAAVQVWVFPAGEDVQQVFAQNVLGGSPVSSQARLAMSPDEMSQAVANDVNAIGILPGHWKAGNVSDVYTLAGIPVLALVSPEAQSSPDAVLRCMQK